MIRSLLLIAISIMITSARPFLKIMCLLYEVVRCYLPSYLVECESPKVLTSGTRITYFSVKCLPKNTKVIQNSFLPFCLSVWSKLDCHIRNFHLSSPFRNTLGNISELLLTFIKRYWPFWSFLPVPKLVLDTKTTLILSIGNSPLGSFNFLW